jgi:hypothetical protein
VVKAFNTVFASQLNDPVIDGVPLDGFTPATTRLPKKCSPTMRRRPVPGQTR